ncbi:hypothetical protein BJY01DRAFT_61163 [Aspergillus pseudoustus]|uniref:Amino acid permease/ SLC12A domain-containing protein n=1 Tax=Aspergillus pseudoustus TaxID=1810923 RepID=A0ABR4J7T2_9EURO
MNHAGSLIFRIISFFSVDLTSSLEFSHVESAQSVPVFFVSIFGALLVSLCNCLRDSPTAFVSGAHCHWAYGSVG